MTCKRTAALTVLIVLAGAHRASWAEEFRHRFGVEPAGSRAIKRIGPPQAFTDTEAGLLVKLPAGRTQAGVETLFGVSGDFEITAGYELVDVPQPDHGYGSGVILRLGKAHSEDFAAVGRRRRRNGTDSFNTNFSTWNGNDFEHDQKFHDAEHQQGELRVVRNGTMLTYLVKEGDAETFRKLRDLDFGTVPLESIRFLGDTGGSRKEVTVRLKHLAVRADGLPFGPPPTPPGRIAWTTWGMFGSAGLFVLIGSLVWLWRFRS